MKIHDRQVMSLMKAPGITSKDAELLIARGVPTLAHAIRLGKEKLLAFPGIGEAKAASLANRAQVKKDK